MSFRERDDGTAGFLAAVFLLIVALGIGATVFGVIRFRTAAVEAERRAMEAQMQAIEAQKELELLRRKAEADVQVENESNDQTNEGRE